MNLLSITGYLLQTHRQLELIKAAQLTMGERGCGYRHTSNWKADIIHSISEIRLLN